MTIHTLPVNLLANSTDYGAGGLYLSHISLPSSDNPALIDWAAIIAAAPSDPTAWYTTLAGHGTSEYRVYQDGAVTWDDKGTSSNLPADTASTPEFRAKFKVTSNAGTSATMGIYSAHGVGVATPGGGGGGGSAGSSYPDDPRTFRGQNVDYDYGTTDGVDYTILVDHAGSGDYTTVTAAMAAATAGDIIAIKTGTYAEAVTLKSGVTLQGYGTHRPVMSAQQTISGFSQCSAADAAVLGSVLGVNGSPVYKKTGILKSSIPVSDLQGLNPTENGVPLAQSQDRLDQTYMFFQEDEAEYYNPVTNGGNYVLSGSTITGVTDPVVITSSRYSDAELLAAHCRIYASPNKSHKVNITASDVASNTITIAGGFAVDGTGKRRFAIGNAPKAMVAGTWVWVDQGTSFDLYVYPFSAADIDKIAVVARKTIITLATGGPTNVAVKGINFIGASGSALYEGSAIADSASSNLSSGITIENCKFTGFSNYAQDHKGAVWLGRADNILIQNCTFRYCTGHGVFPTGSGGSQTNCLIRRCVFSYCGSAGAKAYSQSKYAFFHNYHFRCGFTSHGNLGNVYISGTDAIWFGNEFDYCQGYLTAQAMVNAHFLFNWLPADNKYSGDTSSTRSHTKIRNQGYTGITYGLNNSILPTFTGTANQGHIALDLEGATAYYANNVAHSMIPPADHNNFGWAYSNLCWHNGYTGSHNLGASDFLGGAGQFDTTNIWAASLAAVFVDWAARDWTPIAGSPILTMATYDIESIVDTLKTTFPAVPAGDWDVDCFGGTIDYNNLKMGADQSI